MKRISALFLAFMLLLGCAFAEETVSPATLTAVGTAPVEVTGVTTVLSFSLSAEAQTAAETNAAMDASYNALMQLLSGQGVDESDVLFTRYDMEHVYDYHHTKMSETKLLQGYKLEAGLVTYLDGSHQARAIVDALFENGMTADYKLTFEHASSAEAEDEALALAAQEAMHNAGLLADVMGAVLGDMLSVEETIADGYAQVEVTYAVK